MAHELHNETEHDQFILDNPRAIIFFGSIYCGHCRSITPTFNEYVNKYPNIAFAHIETTTVKSENLEGVPTFVGYKDGEAVDIVVGADKQGIIRMLKTLAQ